MSREDRISSHVDQLDWRFVEEQTYPLELNFEKAGKVKVVVTVKSIATRAHKARRSVTPHDVQEKWLTTTLGERAAEKCMKTMKAHGADHGDQHSTQHGN